MTIVLLYFSCLIVLLTATDYCKKELCRKFNDDNTISYVPHIACNNSGNFSLLCPKNAYVFILKAEHKKQILSLHNTMRNTIAAGNLSGFASAKRMPTLIWNDELAKFAVLNAKQCEMKHDKCRSTEQFLYAGQNLARRSWTGNYSDATNIEFLVNSWFIEYKYSCQEAIDEYKRRPSNSEATGHFTVMVHEKVSEVGCAIVRYDDLTLPKIKKKMLLVCNYSFTNFLGEPIYRKGIKCSECLTGCNVEYNALCKINEKINLNSSKTIKNK